MMSFTRLRKINTWYDRSLIGFLAVAFWVGMNHVGRNLGGVGIELPFNLFFLIGMVIFALFATIKVALSSRVLIPKPFGLIVLTVLLLLIPLLYVNRVLLDTIMIRYYSIGGALFYLLLLYQITSARMKNALLMVLFLSSVIQTLWGLLQFYFIYEPTALFYRADLGQPYGVFQQINDFGSYLAVGSVVGLYYAFFSQHQARWKYLVSVLLIFCNAHLTELAMAETGKIVNLVSVFLYLAYIVYKRRQVMIPIALFAVCFIGAILPREWVSFRPDPSEYVSVNRLASNASAANSATQVAKPALSPEIVAKPPTEDYIWWRLFGTRSVIYPIVIQMIMEKPWAGFGPGTFTKHYLLHQGEYLKKHPDAPAEFNLDHPHNEILNWVVEFGVFTLFGFAVLIWGCVRLCKNKDLNTKIMLLGLPILVHSMLELPVYHSAPHGFLLISLLFIATRSTRTLKIKLPKLSKVIILPVAFWAFVQLQMFFLSTVYALQMLLLFNKSERTQVQYLLSINNPAAFKLRREFEIFQYKLRKAREERTISMQDLQNFLYWAYSTVQYAPLESTYQNFIEGLRIGGKHAEALKYAKEANLMYPKNTKFIEYLAFYEEKAKASKVENTNLEPKHD